MNGLDREHDVVDVAQDLVNLANFCLVLGVNESVESRNLILHRHVIHEIAFGCDQELAANGDVLRRIRLHLATAATAEAATTASTTAVKAAAATEAPTAAAAAKSSSASASTESHTDSRKGKKRGSEE